MFLASTTNSFLSTDSPKPIDIIDIEYNSNNPISRIGSSKSLSNHSPTNSMYSISNQRLLLKQCRSLSFTKDIVDDFDDDDENFSLNLQESNLLNFLNNDAKPYFKNDTYLHSLPLTPFSDQVGGHASFLRFSEKALCKPLNPNERDFYEIVETKHPELNPYVARCLGPVTVSFNTNNNKDGQVDIDWIAPPLIILEENQHILNYNDEDESEDESSFNINNNNNDFINSPLCYNTKYVNISSPPAKCNISKLNRKLRNKVFKEALSPNSLRTRFAQLKFTEGAIKKNSSILNLKAIDASKSNGDISLLDSKSTAVNMKTYTSSKVSANKVCSTNKKEKLQDLDKENCNANEKQRTEDIFAMSEDDEISDKKNTFNYMNENEDEEALSLRKNKFKAISSSNTHHSVDELSSSGESGLNFNPWSLHCYSNQIQKIRKSESNDLKSMGGNSSNNASSLGDFSSFQFLLLEDLTVGMKHPCILDLKMGTRQHSINSTFQKKVSQEKKCEKTTSKNLGVRICGMQVYKKNTKQYQYLDKYVGRNINQQNFTSNLKQFLHDGQKILINLIPVILKKLKNLLKIIKILPNCRFYASSLLILYDGGSLDEENEYEKINFKNFNSPEVAEEEDLDDSKVKMKMIDFAHCISNANLLKSNNNNLNILDQNNDTSPQTPLLSTIPSDLSNNPNYAENGANEDGFIKVNYPPTTRGPDNGYILGLITLIKSFEEILIEANS
ncbi:hypothetical protein HK099_005088, partial [Clydaea vesicula]